jgi:hypothetical protein
MAINMTNRNMELEEHRLELGRELYVRYLEDRIRELESKGSLFCARARLVSGIQIALGEAYEQGKHSND